MDIIKENMALKRTIALYDTSIKLDYAKILKLQEIIDNQNIIIENYEKNKKYIE